MTTKSKQAEKKAKQATEVQSSPRTQLPDEIPADATHPIVAQMTALFLPKMEQLQTGVDALASEVKQFSQRMGHAEQRISDIEDRANDTEATVQRLDRQVKFLTEKVEDLENRSRRNNLRLVGLPESILNKDLMDFVQLQLPKILGLPPENIPLVVERAHRIGAEHSPTDRTSPRQVIFKLLNYQTKMTILQAYRQTKDLAYQDKKLLLFQDFSSEVARKRKEFAPYCNRLYGEGRKVALLYPARLRLQTPNGPRFFASPKELQMFLGREERLKENQAG